MKKIWEWLDGKKTTIGTVMLFASGLFKEHTTAHQILYYTGTFLGGTGILHKTKKREFAK